MFLILCYFSLYFPLCFISFSPLPPFPGVSRFLSSIFLCLTILRHTLSYFLLFFLFLDTHCSFSFSSWPTFNSLPFPNIVLYLFLLHRFSCFASISYYSFLFALSLTVPLAPLPDNLLFLLLLFLAFFLFLILPPSPRPRDHHQRGWIGSIWEMHPSKKRCKDANLPNSGRNHPILDLIGAQLSCLSDYSNTIFLGDNFVCVIHVSEGKRDRGGTRWIVGGKL